MPSIQQDILWDDGNDKRSLISECIMVIWIGVHPAGEEPGQHVIRVDTRVSRTTTVRKVRKEPAQPLSWAISFSLQQTTFKQGGMVQQSSYWATRFARPHQPDMWSVQIKACQQGQNDTALNQHRWGLSPWNLRIATTLSPPSPFEWSTFLYLPRPVTPINMNININHYSS
jgi:hypothetical protein